MAPKTVIIIGAIAIIIIAAFLALNFNSGGGSGKYDDLAACLSESGAKMYGAYWCSHCQNQKQMFGGSFGKVDYVECALQGGGQADACTNAGVRAYPTWIFGDGTKVEGELTLQKLGEYSGCKIS